MPNISKSEIAADSTRSQHGFLEHEQLKSIDRSVGVQIRARRNHLGISQDAVAKTMSLTFQQLQKYEHGTNRVSGSRLYQLAMILQVPVSYFFEAIDAASTPETDSTPEVQEANAMPGDIMKQRRTGELVRAFYAIEGEKQRASALSLLKTMAKANKAVSILTSATIQNQG